MYNDKNFRTSHPLTFGLSMAAGGGVVLAIVALGVGVLQPDASSTAIGMLLVTGLALFVIGVGGWLSINRPYEHFDDITKPLEDDHGHTPAATDHVIVVSESAAVEPHGEGHH